MKEQIKVRCNKCGWTGFEEELELIGIAEINGEEIPVAHESRNSRHVTVLKLIEAEEFIDGCPNCLTDDYLMNIETN